MGDSTGGNTDGMINFSPKMGEEKLSAGYKKVISALYAPKNYFRRINTFLKNYNPKVKTRLKLSFNLLSAFFRSMWSIGVMSKARFYYWKLLIKTFFTKIKAFPLAVEHAICWKHFSIIAQQTAREEISREIKAAA